MIKEGEKVLLVDPRGKKYIITVGKKDFHTDLGILKLEEIVGKNYGESIVSHKGYEFKILKPKIVDLIEKMKRGPQIVHPKDAALIVAYAGISPGDFIVEAGVGSGALTLFLANIIGPTGRIVSYEIREDFAKLAWENIKWAGFDDRVEIKIKDIYEGIDEENVDHVILDLPQPERVVEHAAKALKPGGYLVAYLPCANQVIRLHEKLAEFRDVFLKPKTIDVVVFEQEVKKECIRPRTTILAHTGYITFARKR
ncbi:tRNA methyltransferase [Pyrococcus furiosus DSM 3638]|uniref:L-isoaspartyl protein carboxyl methyltransferase n=3 Tax=Pyrococcus furiosus TaxID=2261 RepID=Q8TZT7_PYRFU|nr:MULTISPECIES: tRNA (adenine-N1)-methyltransferase [Pyrococcus]AAL82020.1 l-isoaspartyl protein carboxyl methyltransferase [Pyrococcus furiosus DSM 3638]AFN04744.1 l-isoaspartyl protein carboxyl methyltransferase [Pyrococcus furiosus COM1]MDK2870037.1 tRNA (adenine57-N1/adenine58-N1)-methyltransferase catalytic subunit [Pyrococcus sp.]QEK79493.1 tRNA methyltransferase [Pyrococcus furiosus DSM 3638]